MDVAHQHFQLATNKSHLDRLVAESEPIVINGHILSPIEVERLALYEHTSTTTTTTQAPWSPAGLIGEEEERSKKALHSESSTSSNAFRNRRPYSALQDDQGFLNTFVIQGLSSVKGNDKSVDMSPISKDEGLMNNFLRLFTRLIFTCIF